MSGYTREHTIELATIPDDRQRVIMTKGEPSGMVYCPSRRSSIAVMRCGEYQVRDGCASDCRFGASEKEIERLKSLSSGTKSENPYVCPMCDGVKATATSRVCVQCENKRRKPKSRENKISNDLGYGRGY